MKRVFPSLLWSLLYSSHLQYARSIIGIMFLKVLYSDNYYFYLRQYLLIA